MGAEYVCVIDRGTTNVKGVLFDTEGREHYVHRVASEAPFHPYAGWFEQDMDGIWRAAADAARGCVDHLEVGDRIIGVSVTGQGSGIFPIDEDGKPVRRGIPSLDTRAMELVEEYTQSGLSGWWKENSGNYLYPGMPLLLLKWMQLHEPEAYRRTRYLLFSKDWVRLKLTGEVTTDITDTAPASLIGKDERSYLHEGFEKLGLVEKSDVLPPMLGSCEIAGYVTAEAAKATGLTAGTPVVTGAHDMMSCCMGIGSVRSDYLLCLIGTWGANYMVTPQRTEGLCNPHMVPGYYVLGYLDGNSGAALDQVLRMMYGRRDRTFHASEYYKDAEKRAREAAHQDLLCLPYFFGTAYEQSLSGSILNMKGWHTGDDLLLAAYKGIAMCHYDNVCREMPLAAGIERVYLGGGGAGSDLFGELFAAMFRKPVLIPASSELTARGAAIATLAGLGIKKSIEDALILTDVKKTFEPRNRWTDVMQENYERYKQAFRALHGGRI